MSNKKIVPKRLRETLWEEIVYDFQCPKCSCYISIGDVYCRNCGKLNWADAAEAVVLSVLKVDICPNCMEPVSADEIEEGFCRLCYFPIKAREY
jgi:hypothetical protein